MTMKQHEIDALIDEHDMGAWRTLMHRYTHALLSKAIPEGYVVVPKEPTDEMIEAADNAGFRGYTGTWTIVPDECWAAMIAAAPSVEGEGA